MTDRTAPPSRPPRTPDRAGDCIRLAVLTGEDTAAALIDRAIALRRDRRPPPPRP